MIMHKIEVGKLYMEGHTSWPESAEWNWAHDLNELRLFFRDPQTQEVQAVKRGKAEFGLVVEQDLIFLVFRFLPASPGQQGLTWSDAPYSYHMLPQDRKVLPEQEVSPDERSLLQVVLINASTGITLAIRGVSLSPEFTLMLYQAILGQAEKPFDQVKYDRQLRWIYSMNDSKKLFARAIVRCVGGA